MTDYSEDAPSGKPLESLGELIRKQREHLRLSQTELAQRAGITREYLNKIERGRVNPSAEVKEKLGKALGIHLNIERLLHARRIDDLLAAFLPGYPHCLIDPVDSARKILGKRKSPRDIFNGIVKKYGLAAENLLQIERLREILSSSRSAFLEEILLIAEAIGASPRDLIELACDWERTFILWKRALQQEQKKDPKRQFDIPKLTRFHSMGYRCGETFRASFKDVETALDEFLNMLEIKLA